MKDDIINIYEKLPKKYLNDKDKDKNPNYKKHLIKDPVNFRALIVGPSGSGKTQILINLLNRMSDTYFHLYLVCPNQSQVLYSYLRDILGDNMTCYKSVAELPPHKELEPIGKPKFIVFDDLISVDKKQMKIISDYFIGARHSKCALAFLSQSFYDVPKIIRLNCNYIFIRAIGNNRDLSHIIKTYSLNNLDKETLTKIYKYATDEMPNFLMIDLDNPSFMFRRNFLEILNPKDFGYKEEL
jgi:hypothetical protein